MDLDGAIAFIRRQGDSLALARLASVLEGTAPTRAQVEALLGDQLADGGWAPPWAPQPISGLDATCSRLSQASWLGLTTHEGAIAKALGFLALRQQSDGSWQEDPALAPYAPDWVKPDNPAASLYLTANCGYWLAYNGEEQPARHAATFLLNALDHGQLPSFVQTHWLAAALWLRVGQSALADRLLITLQARVPELPASSLAWMINSLDSVGLPAEHLLMSAAAERLALLQQPDGRWASEDGPLFDVQTTLEALHALRVCTSVD